MNQILSLHATFNCCACWVDRCTVEHFEAKRVKNIGNFRLSEMKSTTYIISYPNSKSKIFFQLSGVHYRLQKWVLMMILTWIWPIGLMSSEQAVLDSEQQAPETAGSEDIKPIGQIQIWVRIIICTQFWSLSTTYLYLCTTYQLPIN